MEFTLYQFERIWAWIELVRSRWSSELRRVYPGVYGWVESCSTGDHAQSTTPQTIQVPCFQEVVIHFK